ncbi:MAG: type II toxin-antitoxin system RelE/ParE family toxin [Acidobacteria bacterium]|nr:type II toxin-antitoxin system RelE/ParE family toxin [Acidobacteriota bacterium]
MPRAERDLEIIFQFVQADTSTTANKWFNGLIDAIESLSVLPQRNPGTTEDPALRQLLYGNKPHIYRIIYSIDLSRKIVDILHVRHGARDSFDSTS